MKRVFGWILVVLISLPSFIYAFVDILNLITLSEPYRSMTPYIHRQIGYLVIFLVVLFSSLYFGIILIRKKSWPKELW